MSTEHIRDLLSREPDVDSYRAIREEWKRHSLAEDARDIAGLISHPHRASSRKHG